MKLEHEHQFIFTRIINKWGLPVVENENNWEFTHEDKMCFKNEHYFFVPIVLFLFVRLSSSLLKYYTMEYFSFCFLTKDGIKRSHGLMIKDNKNKYHWMGYELC